MSSDYFNNVNYYMCHTLCFCMTAAADFCLCFAQGIKTGPPFVACLWTASFCLCFTQCVKVFCHLTSCLFTEHCVLSILSVFIYQYLFSDILRSNIWSAPLLACAMSSVHDFQFQQSMCFMLLNNWSLGIFYIWINIGSQIEQCHRHEWSGQVGWVR